MKFTRWCILLLELSMTILQCSLYYFFADYLQDSCSCTALHKLECDDFMLAPVIGGAGHVALSRSVEFSRPFHCQFTIRAPEEMKVKLTIHNITIPLSKSCKAGFLSVYDGVPNDIKGWPLTGKYTGSRYRAGLILGLCSANERRCYKVTTSLTGWAQG